MSKVILITGVSRGIGTATARLAVGRGYRVVINYRRQRETAEALPDVTGGR
ncbi:SDR family NAD(P)-dependent oxidoreductase [Pseudomonas argentinensis]|uniref:Short chain dehydrogenase n=1 Tax=Phytopseudomonas argentinensis TaxID=289370 RepID=A0A1I3H0V6_9GAMM|nr:SDR family NAD(P)-dependent oxidoreductase [Pseudomonas argentinensis]KAB0548741.1 SDR family NAD(P)-dependent oxidoreductase [Pseudomonas argentinensis]SFI29303.1 short chain dehydrogenase [Pseudomonas argentinensis]